jgi:hypothetical protein
VGTIATRDQINDFLKRFKAKVDGQGHLPMVPRRENLNTLAMLGMSRSEVKTTVLAFTESEYRSGPEADHDKSSGEIWEFQTDCAGREIYVKLKLDDKIAKCLSFHPSAKYQ